MPKLTEKAYADHIAFAIVARDGAAVADYLSFQDAHVKNLFTSLSSGWNDVIAPILNRGEELEPSNAPARSVQDFRKSLNNLPRTEANAWTEILSCHVFGIIFLHDRDEHGNNTPDYDRVFIAQLQICKIYSSILRQSSKDATGWALPLIFTLCRELRAMAISADKDREARGEKRIRLEEASRTITSFFSVCVQDSGEPEESRRMGAYYLACLLFKTYFKLRTLALCKNIRRGIDNTDLLPFDAFPMAHRVTYSYYLGVIAFLNENYDEAEEKLMFALLNCHRKADRNRELILTYLIPIRLMRGILPSPLLLGAFKRLKIVYEPFVSAYRSGNVRKYDEALVWAEKRLLESGTYLAVESAREGCLKNMLRRVYKYTAPESRSRISVDTFRRALTAAGVDADAEEVECIVANMIFKGHMKGYISHERQMVVLSNKDAFPRASATAPS